MSLLSDEDIEKLKENHPIKKLFRITFLIIGIFIAIVSVVLALWFVVIIVFALMLTFKKGALTGIVAILGGLIVAGIIFSWTTFIP